MQNNHFWLTCAIVLMTILMTSCKQDASPGTESPTTEQASVTPAAERAVNDFPTLARVEYVLQCMLEHGGQNYDNLYHCTCAADTIASRMSYDDYSQSLTFTYMFNTPGERGGEFRDPPESKRLRDLLKESKGLAQSRCFPDIPKAQGKPDKK